MSKVKLNSNLFLEVAEFKRLQKQFDDWGFKRHIHSNTVSYGIVKNTYIPEIGTVLDDENFYVSKLGIGLNKVEVKSGFIIDKNAEFIVNPANVDIDIPANGQWYWIKVSHRLSNKELGTISVDIDGNVSGVGTEFNSILRGQPNFPSKIRFLNSQNGNVQDYEVVRVIDDFNCILAGDFQNETNLAFAVVGTFTPGYPVPSQDELIFQYDDCLIQVIPETTPNQPPLVNTDYEFLLSRVNNNGITIITQDKRNNWWKPYGEWKIDFLDRLNYNPLIGVDEVQYDSKYSPRNKNLVFMSWGFRFQSYTIDSSQKKVSVLIGDGGVFKTTNDFQSGDFNSWRLYSKNGTYRTIIDSQKSGTQIVLTLDVLDTVDYGLNDKLFIAPPFEEIEIRVRKDGAVVPPTEFPVLETIWQFPINVQKGRIEIQSLKGCNKYNFTYRYRTFQGYTDWKQLPDDPVGLYAETSFDEYGNLKPPIDRVRKPYVGHMTNGFIVICEAPDSFDNFKGNVFTGDNFGVNTTALSNSVPVLDLEVGVDKQYQHFKGNLTLTADLYIHLKRTKQDGSFFNDGNFFLLQFSQFINLNGFKLRIVEDYIDPTNYTLLVDLDENDLMYVRNNTSSNLFIPGESGLFIRCTFNDLNHWIATYTTDINPKGSVRMLTNNAINGFDISGLGTSKGFWGWRIMNGLNGTVNMDNRFPRGVTAVSAAGTTGGANSFTIGISNLPEHSHGFNLLTNNSGQHNHMGSFSGNNVFEGGSMPGTAVGKEGSGSERFKYGAFIPDGFHTHTITGSILPDGGVMFPQPIDNRPESVGFVFIEKYV